MLQAESGEADVRNSFPTHACLFGSFHIRDILHNQGNKKKEKDGCACSVGHYAGRLPDGDISESGDTRGSGVRAETNNPVH